MSGFDVNPIEQAEQRLEGLLAGGEPPFSAAEVRLAVDRALVDKEGGYGGRSVGFAIIHVRDLYDGGDFQEFLVALTDGTRYAAIVARLSGSAVAGLHARGEDVIDHLLERMRSAVGTLPNDGARYKNVILNHPRGYNA